MAPETATPKPLGPFGSGIGTAFAVNEMTVSPSPAERKFTRFVPSSTGPPRLTTQAGLKMAMRSPLAANEPQDSVSQDPSLPISASSTKYAPPSLAAMLCGAGASRTTKSANAEAFADTRIRACEYLMQDAAFMNAPPNHVLSTANVVGMCSAFIDG